MKDDPIVRWLLEGDVSIQFQTRRDLIGIEDRDLRDRISREGWGHRLLSLRNSNGHWARGFYQPKWTSSHYTLFDLRNLDITPDIPEIAETLRIIGRDQKSKDGGINPAKTIEASDVCVNGMFLNYASYFGMEEEDLKSVVDFLLAQQMADGGFNCQSNQGGATHSSLHSTLSVLEGILEYTRKGYGYRIRELRQVEQQAQEFILVHRLFRSHRTGAIINQKFLRFPYPHRWFYDILRSLDYFRMSQVSYDPRMQDAIDIVLKKRRKDGTWPLHAAHPGQTHFEMETPGQPSRWNTLRARRVLEYFGVLTHGSHSAFLD